MTKQVKFRDVENDCVHGGIRLEDGTIICGCCGAEIDIEEQQDKESFTLLEEYDDWVDLDEAITGGE